MEQREARSEGDGYENNNSLMSEIETPTNDVQKYIDQEGSDDELDNIHRREISTPASNHTCVQMEVSNEDKSIRGVDHTHKNQFENSNQGSHFDSIARQRAIENDFPENIYLIVSEIKSDIPSDFGMSLPY
jgi:hypothetical protein